MQIYHSCSTLYKLSAFCLIVSLSACSLIPRFDADLHPVPVFHSVADSAQEIPAVSDIDILYISEEVKRYLDYHVGRTGDNNEKMNRLRNVFTRRDLLSIRYDQFKTRTAMETFKSRRGDCISFANLFVAMARYVGIDAHYQDVMIPLDWDMSGNINILNKHINVAGRIGTHANYVMDILPYQNSLGYYSTKISDTRARAQYFSNLGIELMQKNLDELALSYLKRAAIIDPALELVWTNAGAVYSRNKKYSTAEEFYKYALLINDADMTAMNNLASLYEKKGETEKALSYLEKIERYRLRNPYYRYQMAFSAYQAGDFHSSRDHLENAIRKEKADARLHVALAKVYYQLGDYKQAELSLDNARKHAIDSSLYDKPLEILANEEWFES